MDMKKLFGAIMTAAGMVVVGFLLILTFIKVSLFIGELLTQ